MVTGYVSRYLIALFFITYISLTVGSPDKADIPYSKHCNDSSCSDEHYLVEKKSSSDSAAPPGINDKTRNVDNRGRHPYERDGKYWLVPPFLIGACSVIVIYIFVHCIYLHCYAKKKLRKLSTRHLPPAIIISDDPTSTNSYQPYTPIVTYEGSYGQTEIHPFLMCHPFDDNEWERQLEQRRRSSVRSSIRKKSFSLQIPKLFGSQRPSVCSAAAVLDPSASNIDPDAPKIDARPARASICFVPVGRTLSEPVGGQGEFAQVQGFMYPTYVLPKGQVTDGSGGPTASGDCESNPQLQQAQQQHPPPPIILIRRPSAQIATAPPISSAIGKMLSPDSAASSSISTPHASSGVTSATVHSDSKSNNSVKTDIPLVTFRIEDCDTGQETEIPLEGIQEEGETNK